MSNIGYSTLTVIPSLRGFGRTLDRGVDPAVASSGQRSGRTFGNLFARNSVAPIRSGFGSIARIAAGAFAGVAAGAFLKGSITAASDLNETLSKVQVVIGKQATPAVRAFAKRAAKDFGQSEQSALDAAATFAVFGKSAGLQGPKLGKFSTKLTALASDMASFSNTTPDEAIQAIGAALRGESEPIRRYGVLLDDASLRQEALRQGLVKTTKEALTPQQRVLAAQALIFKQTSDAQGDFARTSGGLANQQRILSAQFDNLKTKIGSAFLPVALGVVKFFNTKLIPAFSTAKETVGNLAGAFRDGLRGNVSGTGVFRVVGEIGDKVGGLVDFLQGIQWRRLAGRAVTGIAAGLRGAKRVWDKVEPNLTAFGRSLFDGGKQTAQELINGVRVGVATGDWEPLGKAITDGLGRAATGAKGLAGAVGTWVKSVDWLSLGKTAAGAAVPFVIGMVNGLAGAFIDTAIAHPLDVVAFATAFIPAGRLAGVLEKVFGKLPIIGPILRSLKTAGAGVEGGVMRFIVRPLGRLGGFILSALLDGFRLVFPKAGRELAFQLGLFPLRVAAAGIRLALAAGRMIASLVEGIRGQLKLVGAQAALIAERLLRPFAKAGSWLFGAGKRIVTGLISGMRSALPDVGGIASKIANKIGSFFPGSPVKTGPLKVLNNGRSGRLIAQMLASGMAAGANDVGSSANLIARRLNVAAPLQVGPRPLATPRATTSTVNSAAPGVTFDVTQHVTAPDPRQAAAESANRLRAFVFERTGSVVG